MLKLREYQSKTLNKLYCKLKECKKVVVSLPTGAGKTVMMAAWANKMAEKGKKTAIIVDRIELVKQTKNLIPNATILKSGWKEQFDSNSSVYIIMLQTGYKRLNVLLDLNVDYVFFDEVHNYVNGQMFAAVCDCWNNAKIIGVSATPIDDKGYLLEQFDDIICEIQTQELISLGYLVKPVHYAPYDYNLDLSCIRMTNGDYDNGQLDEVMTDTNRLNKIHKEWEQVGKGRKTIVFCTSIKQAKMLNELFAKSNCNSRVIHSEMKQEDRDTHLYNFRIGIVDVLFNVGILVAGFDEPTVSCILFANPTKVLRRYLQQAGRGLRIADNKNDCLILDCANNIREHGFCDDLRYYRKRQRVQDQCTIKQCPECGAIVEKNTKICPYCGYDFSLIIEEGTKVTKRQIKSLEKAFNMQQELKQQIAELVNSRGYKNGYKWYLFIDCLKTKIPTESAIRFFKRKLTKIKHIKQKGWKLASLKYN